MPRTNKFTDLIPKLYRRHAFDLLLFAFIDTYRFIIPSVTVKEAAQAFLSHHKISTDLYDLDSCIVTFYRIQKEVIDAERSK